MDERRESPSGYHFWNLFQCCNRKFYIKYPLGIKPFFTAPALIFGAIFHEAKATFYTTGSYSAASETFRKLMQERKEEYKDQERFAKDAARGLLMLDDWVETFGARDLKFYDILKVEEEMTPTLPNGWIITIRPDMIAKSKKTNRVYIFETKTTSFSVPLTINSVRAGDQATTYLWGVDQVYPDLDVEGIIVDVSYQRQSKIRSERPDVVYRTDKDKRDFELGTVGLLAEISQKIQGLSKFPDAMLFRRNTEWCTSYSHPCEYIDICREELSPGVAPYGFVVDDWHILSDVKNINYDLLDRVEVELT